ncbi:hypothetical protein ACTXN4_07400 [Pseudomonas helleri]|uniref:hypothetical protein n=1 Tax=Pseudomonas helleri TaxID=1608996 RepID=UPI003FD1D219
MKAEDLQVKEALVAAGFDVKAATTRAELHEVLTQILNENPTLHDDFVDRQRTILSDAQHREDHLEFVIARTEHPFVKACPECGYKPDVGLGYWSATDEVLVVCMNHSTGAVTRAGASLTEALKNWNADDWFSLGHARQQFQL